MKEIIESKEITFPKLLKNNDKQFMNLLSIEFDFGYIHDVDYDSEPGSRIYVITPTNEYMVRLWDIIENHSQDTMTIRYSIFVD
jgi:hypothetical protein